MSNNRLFFYLMFVIISLFCLQTSFSQIECPGENDPCPNNNWTSAVFSDHVGLSGANLKVKGSYEWRLCNGVYQLRNFDITADYEDFFNSGNYNEESFDGLKEYAEIQALAELIATTLGGYNNIPDCNDPQNPPIMLASIYSADCGVWLRCSYEFDCEPVIKSDGPSQIGYVCEPPWNNNGKKVVDVWHWEPCGDVCCEKTYEICRDYSPSYGGSLVKINNVNRHKQLGSECSKKGQFFKWDTSTPIPCKDGCQGDGN